ncbi:nitroreductase, partial [Aeromicrobium phragmitis]
KAIEADTEFGSDFDFPRSYEGVYRDRRREVGWQLYEAVGVERGDREASAREMLRNFEFFGAPHAAILTVPASLGVYALVDAGPYVQSFLLAVHAYGLGAIAQAALAQKSALLREWFEWDDD